jgi:hypothetical protein
MATRPNEKNSSICSFLTPCNPVSLNYDLLTNILSSLGPEPQFPSLIPPTPRDEF